MIHKDIPLNERIIFALDVDSKEAAKEWVERLGSHIRFFKVGLQLFIAGWFGVIDMITDRGHKVMCDLKIFDVPETVKLAIGQLKNRGVTFATVHGNDPILRAAVEEKNGVKILAVTVLTSFGEEEMREMGFTGTIEDLVFRRATRALEIGCDGVVSSGLEAPRLRENLGENSKEAIIKGADYVVVGRPISTASDPIAVVEAMQDEIQQGLAASS
jgi:orotidine-5'-phosphate decarboxylase